MKPERFNKRNSRSSLVGGLRMIFFLAIPAVILFLSLNYCTPQSCFEETNSFLKITFYSRTTNDLRSPDSLTLYGIGVDTVRLYNKRGSVQPAKLPLDASDGNSVFVIRINGVNDTIAFNYTTYPHLISRECGYSFYHKIDTPLYTRNIIYTITLEHINVTTLNEENIRIYF